MKNIQLIHGDAFEELPKLAPGSVDCILTDPPYGTTRNAWDKAPDWERLFAELWRVLKEDGALLIFAQNPLAAELICMQRRYFRYEWVWEKTIAQGWLNANHAPMRAHELILCFYRRRPRWNRAPIPSQRGEVYTRTTPSASPAKRDANYGKPTVPPQGSADGARAPRDVILCGRERSYGEQIHPTQKPVELCRAILSQYVSPGDLVLDPFAGSASVLLASHELRCRAIGFELCATAHERAKSRLSECTAQLTLLPLDFLA